MAEVIAHCSFFVPSTCIVSQLQKPRSITCKQPLSLALRPSLRLTRHKWASSGANTFQLGTTSTSFPRAPSRHMFTYCAPVSMTQAAPSGDAAHQRTWSNPTGRPLRPVKGDSVWAAERPFVWISTIDVGGRMGTVKLQDGSVWVHSPVPLDAALKAEMDKLGPVKHVVSPNYEHAGFAKQWLDAYPQAIGYACPGLAQKRPETGYHREVGQGDVAPAEWLGEFEFAWLDCEHNPFTQKPFFNEVVFCHKPSGVLFVSDLFWNYPQKDTPVTTWLWKQGMDRVYLPFYKRFMLFRRDRFRQILDTILSWQWDSIVPCHGDVIEQDGKQVLRQHLR
eukprot:jgi/Mesen1/432/ME001000S10639